MVINARENKKYSRLGKHQEGVGWDGTGQHILPTKVIRIGLNEVEIRESTDLPGKYCMSVPNHCNKVNIGIK